MKDSHNALDLFSLPANSTPEAIALRYKQMTAFYTPDTSESSAAFLEMLEKLQLQLITAYDVLPKGPLPPEPASDLPIGGKLSGPSMPSLVKALIFPNASLESGQLLSDQWWEIYRRPVTVFLCVLALALIYIPEPGGPAVTEDATKGPSSTETSSSDPPAATTATAVPDTGSSGSSMPATSGETIVPHDYPGLTPGLLSLTPLPGKNPAGLTEQLPGTSASPGTAVSSLDSGTLRGPNPFDGPSSSMQRTEPPSSSSTVMSPTTIQTPAFFDGGDAREFFLNHLNLVSRKTFWQAYDDLDDEHKSRISLEQFKKNYQGWFLPTKDVQSRAITVESSFPASEHPSKVILRVVPSLCSTYNDGSGEDLLFELVNQGGIWKIHDVTKTAGR